jgi:hypothetical protein
MLEKVSDTRMGRMKRLKVPSGFFCPRNIRMIKSKGICCEVAQAARRMWQMLTEYWVQKSEVITPHGKPNCECWVILNWVLKK